MDDVWVWLAGAVALVVVVGAFVWVLRHRDDATAPQHHSYGAPEVTQAGPGGVGAVTFGADETVDGAPIDRTVP